MTPSRNGLRLHQSDKIGLPSASSVLLCNSAFTKTRLRHRRPQEDSGHLYGRWGKELSEGMALTWASEAQISMRPQEDGTVFVYLHVCVRLCIFDSLFLYYNAASTHSCSLANSTASPVETVLLIIFRAVFLSFLTLTCLPVLPH